MLAIRNSLLRQRPLAPARRHLHVSPIVWAEQPERKSLAPQPEASASAGQGPSAKEPELGPLGRPLGVRERPTTIVKTKTQRMKEMMDNDVLTVQRRHLVKEATKGYFHDLNMTRRHGGKTWIAPKVLIRDDKSLYLPNVSGKSLLDKSTKNTTEICFGKITVLAMLSTRMSEMHAQGFVEPTHNRFSSHPQYQYVQVNLQENLLKAFLVNLFLGKLRQHIPPELHENYLVSTQNMEYVREAMGMTNSKVGYVYLIDENLRIRWAGCADPEPEEIQALESCTGVLLKRLERKVGFGQQSTPPVTGGGP
ncbi:hypothetical protein EST38_g10949 [Candolleomyces aberdarensis]|uniref:Mitochondrial ATPase complex subunit ATP10 n=1 Tax=Candolleomyces aberdarensis TaxID=2316362 RepID=A0A4Q2D9E1_9AGAR|nr:hypothetical protein EST38_g10949 [Candolleomyces aberdarensis]